MRATPEFSETVRWLRKKVFGVSFDDLMRRLQDESDAGLLMSVSDQLRAVETAGSTLSARDLANYDDTLQSVTGDGANNLVQALAIAHWYYDETPRGWTDKLRLKRHQHRDADAAILLGADLYEADNLCLIATSSCTPLPAVTAELTPTHTRDFAHSASEIAYARDALVTIPYEQHQLLVSGASTVIREPKQHVYAGVAQTVQGHEYAVDPLTGIHSLKTAWRAAAAMGSEQHEVSPLAWGLLITRMMAQRKTHIPILYWSVLDAQGPAGYATALSEVVPDSAADLVPATDHIWAVTRRYLSQWHGHFVRSTHEVKPSTATTAADLDIRPHGRSLPTTATDLSNHVVVFDDAALPGLPDILGCLTPTLHISQTAMTIHGGDTTTPALFWLPTGLPDRILCRYSDPNAAWTPIQTR